jgi:hypothetical protein
MKRIVTATLTTLLVAGQAAVSSARAEIAAYRRNLQRGYLERMDWLMTNDPDPPTGGGGGGGGGGNTRVDVSQSDIRPFVRGELEATKTDIEAALNGRLDQATRYHLRDAVVRIDDILEPQD